MTSLLHRLLTAGVLAVWGSVLCVICFTGRITAYLHPTFQPFALVAGCVLALLAFLVLLAPEARSSHGSAPRSSVRGVLTALILVGPLLMAFTSSPDSFGAGAVANRTYVQDIAQLPSASPPTPVEPALPDADSAAPSTAATDPAAADPQEFPKNKRGEIQAQVVDFLYAAQLPEMRAELENKPVEVIGQLMPAKNNNAKGDRYDVLRMFMTCCAADAQPVAVPVSPRAKSDLREMTWVRVTGKAAFPVVGGRRTPMIEDGVIERTDPPEDTYLY